MKEEKLQSKIDLVNEIKEKIEAAHSIVLVNYRGLDVENVTALRKELREAGVGFKVYKNTMMRRAFNDLDINDFDELLVGPSAIAFSNEDAVAAAKILVKNAENMEALEIKAGYVDGKAIDVAGVEALSKLPTREVLIAQVLGGLNAPIQGLANVLTGNLRGLAVALDAIREQKEQQQSA
ncbi:MAG: 50S ribosomal protein L10 [Tissierellia bacterium]|nr:50S ribosomal protein L10 [Tissierellia bacterium]